MSNPKVVILGGGFAGIEMAKKLRRQAVDITLVDRQNHHLFQPLLYQVATASLAAPEIAHPIRSILAKQKNVNVMMDEVTGVDLDKKQVRLASGKTLDYDYLGIGLGVKSSYFGNDQWEKDAPGLKTLDEAKKIRRDLLLAFERAETSTDQAERDRLMTTVVIGGGPTGVEMAGSVAELARHVIKRDYRKIDTSTARVYLIEGAPKLLTMYDEDLSDYTEEKLTQMGVNVRTSTLVKGIDGNRVDLGDEVIEAENIIWAAGVAAPSFTQEMGIELDPGGRIIVEGDLSIANHPEVFAMGDIAHCIDHAGVRVPGLCPAAIQMGGHVASVIKEELNKGSKQYDVRKQFKYFDKGSMATIGRFGAVATSKGMKMKGFIAWLMWLFIHLLFLIGFRNRIAVMWQWFYSYAKHQRGARIITGLDRR